MKNCRPAHEHVSVRLGEADWADVINRRIRWEASFSPSQEWLEAGSMKKGTLLAHDRADKR